jgi:hypothetical protein
MSYRVVRALGTTVDYASNCVGTAGFWDASRNWCNCPTPATYNAETGFCELSQENVPLFLRDQCETSGGSWNGSSCDCPTGMTNQMGACKIGQTSYPNPTPQPVTEYPLIPPSGQEATNAPNRTSPVIEDLKTRTIPLMVMTGLMGGAAFLAVVAIAKGRAINAPWMRTREDFRDDLEDFGL